MTHHQECRVSVMPSYLEPDCSCELLRRIEAGEELRGILQHRLDIAEEALEQVLVDINDPHPRNSTYEGFWKSMEACRLGVEQALVEAFETEWAHSQIGIVPVVRMCAEEIEAMRASQEVAQAKMRTAQQIEDDRMDVELAWAIEEEEENRRRRKTDG